MAEISNKLDDSWIEGGLNKLRSRFSNVVFFQTEDPERHKQFLENWLSLEDFRDHQVYEFDPWLGLQVRKENDGRMVFQPVAVGDGDRFAVNAADRMEMQGGLRDPAGAFRHMDRVLKQKSAVLILRELDQEEGQARNTEQSLMSALRSWTVNPELMLRNSAVFCFCSRAEYIVDQHTAGRCAVVDIDLGTDLERGCIMLRTMQSLGIDLFKLDKNYLKQLINLTAGLNLHQLNSVLLESYYKDRSITFERVSELKSSWIKREDVVEINEPVGGFETVGGYVAQKEFIRKNIVNVLNQTERASRYGTPLPKGILFFGPPGTGKSLFAKALAGETRLPFISLKTENLYRSYLGESGRRFGRAIKIIEKNAPAIVFIDEIDRFGRRSGSSTDGASEETRRVFNQLLEWLGDKDRKAILVGTTNRPHDLDPAFIRPGRIDYKIAMLYPDVEARKQILEIHFGLSGVYSPPPVRSVNWLKQVVEYLAGNTEFYSGADLQELVHRVRRNGFNGKGTVLSENDVENAFKSFRINLDERSREVEQYRQYSSTFADQDDLMK